MSTKNECIRITKLVSMCYIVKLCNSYLGEIEFILQHCANLLASNQKLAFVNGEVGNVSGGIVYERRNIDVEKRKKGNG